MAKKSRRARKKGHAPKPVPPVAKTPMAQPSVAIAKEPPRPEVTTKKTVDFATEYHYVYADLKRIAITALAMLAVLIILSFIVR